MTIVSTLHKMMRHDETGPVLWSCQTDSAVAPTPYPIDCYVYTRPPHQNDVTQQGQMEFSNGTAYICSSILFQFEDFQMRRFWQNFAIIPSY